MIYLVMKILIEFQKYLYIYVGCSNIVIFIIVLKQRKFICLLKDNKENEVQVNIGNMQF